MPCARLASHSLASLAAVYSGIPGKHPARANECRAADMAIRRKKTGAAASPNPPLTGFGKCQAAGSART